MSNPFAGIVVDDDLDEFTSKWRGLADRDPEPPSNLREALAMWSVWTTQDDTLLPGEKWADVWRDEHLMDADAIQAIVRPALEHAWETGRTAGLREARGEDEATNPHANPASPCPATAPFKIKEIG